MRSAIRTINLYESGSQAHLSPVDRLRACVDWLDQQEENFVQQYSISKLIRLHAYMTCHPELPEFADSWSGAQLASAMLARPSAKLAAALVGVEKEAP